MLPLLMIFLRFTRLYIFKYKDEADEYFKVFKAEVENQLNKLIKRLQTDRGGEYESNPFNVFCEIHDIIHKVTPPYSPESNGVAERKNRTLKNMMNAMLVSSGASLNLWGEAILSACHIQNRIPYKKTGKTPYELWKGYSPNLGYLKVWGCLAKVLIPDPKRSKLGSKTVDCMFIGYSQNSVAYRFLVLKSTPNLFDANNIIESKDAEFFEDIFPMKLTIKRSLSHGENGNDPPEIGRCSGDPPELGRCSGDPPEIGRCSDDPPERRRSSSDPPESSKQELRRSKRKRVATNFGDDYVFLAENDPQSYEEAMTSFDAPFWREAINNEINSIMSNHTWELVDLPPGTKTLGCKWIFKKKMKADGSIDKYKARLVAKGFNQKKDIDYFDTYAPVSRISSIRVLIALAAVHNLIVHQMDVKTAFLNGDLEEEIYMDQPEGCVATGSEHKVCRLVKSLYGLKQAPKQWHEKFDQVLVSNGYLINEADKCVYYKNLDINAYVIICLYVDDMLIFGTSMDVVTKTKSFLASNCDMKDMGEADVILGIKVLRKADGLILSQEHYVEKFLKRFEYYECKPVVTPYDANTHLKKNLDHSVSQPRYAQIIGSLMYLMNCTRPDIAYAVSRLSRYTHNPSKDHWTALDRVAKYLRGTIDLGLHFGRSPPVIEGYSDANWISDSDEVKSTNGYVFTLGGGAVSWKSSKQTCIARSTMESELIALEKACSEAEWLRNLLANLPISSHLPPSIYVHCDCQAAIARVKSKIYNGKSRHIRMRHSVVQQLLESGVVSLDFVRSELNLADPLTKPLGRRLVVQTSKGMGLLPRS